jgi:CRP-like cAMP-binding protein
MTETRRLAHERLIQGLFAKADASITELVQGLPVRILRLEPHQEIVTEGQRMREACLVLEGFVCRHKHVWKDQRQILSFHIPGDLPDIQSLHLPTVDYSLSALPASTVALFPHAAVRMAVEASADFREAVWRHALIDAAITRAWLASVGRRTAYQRLAHLFCEVFARMLDRKLAEAQGFVLPVTQSDLADALGLSTVHVNRTMQDLRRSGVIETRGRFHGFTDWVALREAADFDPGYLHLPEETLALLT